MKRNEYVTVVSVIAYETIVTIQLQIYGLLTKCEVKMAAYWPSFFFAKKKEIRGIIVKDKEIKLSQYADDTTLISDGSEESFLESLKIIHYFGDISGLRLKSKKTEALWIGAIADWDFKLCPEKDFQWPKKTKVRALGVWLSTDPDVTISLNYKDKIEKIKSILGCWELRRLGLLGKITVLKSLIASQLVYIFSPLQSNKGDKCNVL